MTQEAKMLQDRLGRWKESHAREGEASSTRRWKKQGHGFPHRGGGESAALRAL